MSIDDLSDKMPDDLYNADHVGGEGSDMSKDDAETCSVGSCSSGMMTREQYVNQRARKYGTQSYGELMKEWEEDKKLRSAISKHLLPNVKLNRPLPNPKD